MTSKEESKEVRMTDPVTGGQKGMKPERYSLIPAEFMAEVARVYGHGAEKYAPNNWRKGYPWSWSIDSLYRHISDFQRRKSVDKDSGLHALAHAFFHLAALYEYERLELGTDDREESKPE